MTWALCFNCGATKFGAICPCPECQVTSTGTMNLDIAFSDHRMSKTTLGAFGDVVRSLRKVCKDDEARFWAFIHYVSIHHPEILGVTLAPDVRERCEAVIARAQPPPVTIEESERAKLQQMNNLREDTA